jgi:hypothetical protein
MIRWYNGTLPELAGAHPFPPSGARRPLHLSGSMDIHNLKILLLVFVVANALSLAVFVTMRLLTKSGCIKQPPNSPSVSKGLFAGYL